MKKDVRLPFDENVATTIAEKFGTPIYVYDESGIRATAQKLNAAFAWTPGYKNYFAVKATPTPRILQILHEEGMGFDCSSRAELMMVDRLGISGDDIFYTSNNTPAEDFVLATKLGATINIDDLSQVPVFLEALAGKSLKCVALRYNPGDLKDGNEIIGRPTEAKYGMSLEQMIIAFKQLKELNITELGIHTMVASNELKEEYFEHTAKLLKDAVRQIEKATGLRINFINLGGGLGLNYRLDQVAVDVGKVGSLAQGVLKDEKLKIYSENGRFVTGPHGYLLTQARYIMQKHKTYIGVDASMHNLMRPGMYGAYHHITVLGKDNTKHAQTYDVVGSLCENNDKFAIDRALPEVQEGDLLVIHDAGAHGHAMGFNYNGLLRSAEVLLKANGELELMRRAETVEDYLKTVIWPR